MHDPDFIQGDVRVTEHRGSDDLLSAGLGLAGLAGTPAPYADALHPTAGELRRRAIQNSWKGIADLGPLGGYGRVYGAVPAVPGREYQAFARIPGAHAPHCTFPAATRKTLPKDRAGMLSDVAMIPATIIPVL